jgi:hypothetical protein
MARRSSRIADRRRRKKLAWKPRRLLRQSRADASAPSIYARRGNRLLVTRPALLSPMISLGESADRFTGLAGGSWLSGG